MKNTHQDIYKLLRDSYEGMGGFIEGGYLTKHPRESSEKFSARQGLAYYLNYFKPCVNAHVAPIFKTMAIRDWNGVGANAWEMFINDVDLRGSKIKDLMKQAALKSKINGISFIAVDRDETESVSSLATLEADRAKLPYAFVIDPVRVEEIKVDKFGRITLFKYVEPDAFEENRQAKRTLTADGWELEDSKGVHQGSWNLGMVPVIPVPSKVDNETANPLPPSEFISIAKANLAIYNMSSWLNDILVNQTFSILVYPSNSSDDLILGTSNALGFPGEAAHEPKFIAPSAEPANILHNEIDRLQNECYRMAGVVNVTGVKSEQSGVAKAWDFEQTNQVLSDFADILETAEKKLADLYQRFVGLEFEYIVNYPSDFSIADVETELANAEVAKGLNFGDDFSVEIFKRVLTSYLPEVSDEQFDELVESYKENLEASKIDIAHVPPMNEEEPTEPVKEENEETDEE